jgi:hypothetical protein
MGQLLVSQKIKLIMISEWNSDMLLCEIPSLYRITKYHENHQKAVHMELQSYRLTPTDLSI